MCSRLGNDSFLAWQPMVVERGRNVWNLSPLSCSAVMNPSVTDPVAREPQQRWVTRHCTPLFRTPRTLCLTLCDKDNACCGTDMLHCTPALYFADCWCSLHTLQSKRMLFITRHLFNQPSAIVCSIFGQIVKVCSFTLQYSSICSHLIKGTSKTAYF